MKYTPEDTFIGKLSRPLKSGPGLKPLSKWQTLIFAIKKLTILFMYSLSDDRKPVYYFEVLLIVIGFLFFWLLQMATLTGLHLLLCLRGFRMSSTSSKSKATAVMKLQLGLALTKCHRVNRTKIRLSEAFSMPQHVVKT